MSKSIVSPLSTREARNNLVRRPIRKQELQDDDDDEITFRVIQDKSLRSPPEVNSGRQFTTSSPMEDAPCDENITPGMSVIVGKNKKKNKGDTSTCSKDATPKSGSSGGRRRNRKKGRRIDQDSLTNSDLEGGEDTDDDIQPSGKLTVRSRSPTSYRASSRKFALSDDEEEQDDKSGKGVANSIFGVLLTLICLFGVAVYLEVIPTDLLLQSRRSLLFVSSNKDAFPNHEQALNSVKMNVAEWKSQFSNQEKDAWTVLGASIKGIFKPEARQPSVVLLLAENDALPTAECLSGKIASMVSNLTVNAKPSPQRHASEFTDRNGLYRQIEQDLSSSSTFMLRNLEQVDGEAAMALHAFADNLNAPYKRASLVMTVKCEPKDFLSSTSKEAVAESVLGAAWGSQLDEDRVSPLLSRLTVSVVRIYPEKDLSGCP